MDMKLYEQLLSWPNLVTAIVTFLDPRALAAPVELLIKSDQRPFHIPILPRLLQERESAPT